MNKERRRYTRIGFASDAVLVQGDARFNVHLVDISLNGVLIETPDDYSLNTDEAITIEVTLTGDIKITMSARLAHSSARMLGFHCESIDMDSMTHLRRLIELNMEDPRASERVLKELIANV